MGEYVLRPFNPSERRDNADGSYSTEISRGVEINGEIVNVPSLWKNAQTGKTVDLTKMTDDQLANVAATFERQTGNRFNRFSSWDEAETAATARSGAGGAGADTSRYEAAKMISEAQREMMSRVLKNSSAAMLKRGARGVTVRALQLYLRDQGHAIKADGNFGPETEKALKALQTKVGVNADGRAGSKTLRVVRDAIKTPTPKPRPTAEAIPGGVPPADDMKAAPEIATAPMPGGAPPADDVPPSGGFDSGQYNKDLTAALIGASPETRAHYGMQPEPQIGTPGVQMPAGDFGEQFGGPSLGPMPPDVRTEGYGMSRSGPGTSQAAFSDAFAPVPQMPQQPQSYPTGNSPISPELGTGQVPPQLVQALSGGPQVAQAGPPGAGIGSDFAANAGATAADKQMADELTRKIMQMLLQGGNRPPPAPPPQDVGV